MASQRERQYSEPKWVNPCGYSMQSFDRDSLEKLSDRELLCHIIVQAKNALSHAKTFRDDFIRVTFKQDYEEFHQSWKHNRYDWLPNNNQIPKYLGEDLDKDFLDQVDLGKILLDVYEYLQKFAVALEQISWDQEDHNLQFHKHFLETENQLRAVLCQIKIFALEKGINLRLDVTRDSMPAEFRSMSNSKTDMNLRDWLIFRDYMNALEFVIQVFEHLMEELK